jgi:hypothetical protein
VPDTTEMMLQSIPMLCAWGKAAQSYEALHLAACTGQEDTARGHCQYKATTSHAAEAWEMHFSGECLFKAQLTEQPVFWKPHEYQQAARATLP